MEKFRVNLKNKVDKYVKLNGFNYSYFKKSNELKNLNSIRRDGSTSFKTLFELSKTLKVDVRNLLMFGDSTYIFKNSFKDFDGFFVFIGKRLKEFRVNSGLRAIDIVNRLNNSRVDDIYKIEGSRMSITLKKFYKYLDALEITPDEFFLKDENYKIIGNQIKNQISINDFNNRIYEIEEIKGRVLGGNIFINPNSFPTLHGFLKICKSLKISPKDFFDFDKKDFENNSNIIDISNSVDFIKQKLELNGFKVQRYIKLDSIFLFCKEQNIEIKDLFDVSGGEGNINQMDINLFDFELPFEFIAQKPLENREDSKMMVVNRDNNIIIHKKFYDVIDYLNQGDVLVLNDTRVIPARIKGVNIDSGGKMEFLLVNNIKGDIWEVMCKPGKRALIGKKFSFGNGKIKAEIIDVKDNGNRIVNFKFDGNIYAILNEIGELPLPPYVKEKLNNSERYQTVYSDKIGSIAAPTAGLHFTNDLLDKIKFKNVKVVYITLHVGLGTFMPVKVSDLNEHKMHSEYYEVKKEVVDIINFAKTNCNKVVAVGTTTMRTLESVASNSEDGLLFESSGYTDIFIKPGYKFKIVDSLITNFHLPKSTLLVLISAFYNRDRILNAYEEAILNNYRFFSFGDSMFIL